MSKKEWLTAAAVADRLPNVSAVSVAKWARTGLIDGAVRYPTGRWMIPWDGVVRMIERSTPTSLRQNVDDFFALQDVAV